MKNYVFRFLLSAAALLSLWLVAPLVSAQSAAPVPLSQTLTGEAKSEYEAGKVLYKDGDYAGALLKFSAAYDASKDYRLLWNMVAAEKNLRHYARAIELLDRYLKEGGDKLTASDQTDAAALRDVMKPFVGEVTIKVNQPGATVTVDGNKVGVTPLSRAVPLDMGSRQLRVSKPGFEEYTGAHDVQGGRTQTLTIDLQKKATTGTLVIYAGPKDEISVDGDVVATGTFTAPIDAGPHHVVVNAPGKIPYETDVVVQVGQRSALHVKLEDRATAQGGLPAWVWIAGGVAIAGLGAGAYFLFSPEDETEPPVQGTITPGVIYLP